MRVVDHHTAAELRTLIRRETHAARVRRLQAVLAARDGETAATIAERVQMAPRRVRFWVSRYNTEGLAGLDRKPGQGRKPALTPEQQERFKERIRGGATAPDGVCTLRGEDLRRILADEFGVVRKLQAVYDLVHALGFSVLRPRPRHPKADPATQDAFKKTPPPSSRKSRPPTRTTPSKSGSKTSAASARRAR
jgi:transposase